MHTTENQLTISVPDRFYDELRNRLNITNFESEEEYVEYIIETYLIESSDPETDQSKTVDEKEVEERLESLGYLK